MEGETEIAGEPPQPVEYTDEELRQMDAEYQAKLNSTDFPID
nr:hypothetical protein [Cupriavidus gilardii]